MDTTTERQDQSMHAQLISATRARGARCAAVLTVALALVGCGGGAGAGGGAPDPGVEPNDAAWRALATARPAPLDGAVRVAVGTFELPNDHPWGVDAPVAVSLGLSELVVAGLLRRPDVHFIERRRFAAAVEAERQGTSRGDGAPPIGRSPAPEFILSSSWVTFGGATAFLEMRLVDAERGSVAHAWRAETPASADPVSLARTIVGSLRAQLTTMGRLPSWSDPVAESAPASFAATPMPAEAVGAFLAGLEAEERWDWLGAYRGYRTAAEAAPAFFEAEVALARAARLRLGGTLGES